MIVSPATLSALVSICTNESDSVLANAPPRVNLDLLALDPSILSPIVISLSILVLPILIFCDPVVTLPISIFLADPPTNRPWVGLVPVVNPINVLLLNNVAVPSVMVVLISALLALPAPPPLTDISSWNTALAVNSEVPVTVNALFIFARVVLIPTLPLFVVETLNVAAVCGAELSPPTMNAWSWAVWVLAAYVEWAAKFSIVLPLIHAVPTTSKLARGSVAADTNASA